MNCPNCDTELPDGAKYCPYCGPITKEKSEAKGGSDFVAVRSAGAGSVYAPSTKIEMGEKRYVCPGCGNIIDSRNHLLVCSCGKRFCEHCESFFRSERGRGERPFCEDCFKDMREKISKEKEKRQEKPKLEDIIENSIGMKFKLIPAGEFMMGSDEWEDSQPVHKVKITKPFYIGIYPVTQREWKAVMGDNPSEFKGDDLPVENVSWNDCQEFIGLLNKKEGGWKYRLPTEAEWEYACRAGSQGRYCFGDDEGRLGQYAWYGENSNEKTHTVGTKKPNKWGLHDMHGNVWEWCEDNWHDNYNGAPQDAKAWVPGSGEYGSSRVVRGGGWSSDAEYCASANRTHSSPGYRYAYRGFRLVRSL